MRLGSLGLRITVGAFFIGHGTQKLFGWFGGHGLDATAQAFEGLGLRPGRPNAIAAGVGEAGGGALLMTGRANPLAASVLTATMLTAIRRVHAKNGPWLTNGGYEYNVVLIAAALALAPPSADRLSPAERHTDWAWTLAALLAGLAGAAAAELAASGSAAPSASQSGGDSGSGDAGSDDSRGLDSEGGDSEAGDPATGATEPTGQGGS
jgi:putative oxidoreductase